MSPLHGDLRNQLGRVIQAARREAEAGARKALETLAVHRHEPHGSMTPEERTLRNRLRAHGRQLGDARDRVRGTQEIIRLGHEVAYEHWHRMLFARFLAENHLLIEPDSSVAISMAECEELAREAGEDPWALAARFAQRMLPRIFRPDDPALDVALAPETRQALERLLESVPAAVFTAEDSLGWTYQYWQEEKKDAVNASGGRVGADELPAVTQLFTEHYMVLFLFHNTIGAWRAGKVLAERPDPAESARSENELRQAVRLRAQGGYDFTYLRFVRESQDGDDGDKPAGPWRPAAGAFEGWPKRAAEIRILDPCCGSGHFLVEGLQLLVRLRIEEEGLSLEDALRAVITENLFGLELDARCTQIAAFNVALAAWKLVGRPIELPRLHIACAGLSVGGTREQWLRILEGQGNQGLRWFFGQLYDLFHKAPTLGSLINPHRFLGSGMLTKEGMDSLFRALSAAVAEDPGAPPEEHELGVTAQGLAKAAELLAGRYTLVITNVPYLGRGKQDTELREHLETQYPLGKADLAIAFVLRCLEFCERDGTAAMVTPQTWLFLTTYSKLRETLLTLRQWNIVARLGPGSFETISGHVVNVILVALSATTPREVTSIAGIDVSTARRPAEKAALLRGDLPVILVPQADQLKNADARVALAPDSGLQLLGSVAKSFLGLGTGDFPRYGRFFWELAERSPLWAFHQGPVDTSIPWSGTESLIALDHHINRVRGMEQADRDQIHNQDQSGQQAWGRRGVSVSLMGELRSALYTGERYDKATAVLVPHSENLLPLIWAYCSDPKFNIAVRQIDRNVMCSSGALVKVPFDLAHWQKVAAEKYPKGLPEPESDDPTQWLFHGWPEQSTAPLHVAVARLLGYRWPAELDKAMRLGPRARALVRRCDQLPPFATADGIVCIPSVRGEEPGADRLMRLLSACGIRPDRSLDDWLRNEFFEEHCTLFLQRPFIWHVWDGRKDGFHALVNYHRLAAPDGQGRRALETIAYSYLGDWIERQKAEQREGNEGADARLAAALRLQKELENILKGEPPYDLFVRWKPLREQAIGWNPDINDGVRTNIRPFLLAEPIARKSAGILRSKPNVDWKKDRGKDPARPIHDFPWLWGWDGSVDFAGGHVFSGDRVNDCHYTIGFRRRAREQQR